MKIADGADAPEAGEAVRKAQPAGIPDGHGQAPAPAFSKHCQEQPDLIAKLRAELDEVTADRNAARALLAEPAKPVDMVIFCPACGAQHVDAPDLCPDEGCPHRGTEHSHTDSWTNPPHRSHLCAECGCQWRPADVATNGVWQTKTAGKNDSAAFAARRAAPAGMGAGRCVLPEEPAVAVLEALAGKPWEMCGNGMRDEAVAKYEALRRAVAGATQGTTAGAFPSHGTPGAPGQGEPQ